MQVTGRSAINCSNAQNSTGPRTEAGRKRSPLNAFRHGLTGQTVIMPAEDMDAYNAYCKRAFDQLKPQGFLEEQIAQSIADTNWRLHRGRACTPTLFSLAFAHHAKAAPDLTRQSANLSTSEQRLNRGLQYARKDLAQLQVHRHSQETAAVEEATILRKYSQMHKIPWRHDAGGFVFAAAA